MTYKPQVAAPLWRQMYNENSPQEQRATLERLSAETAQPQDDSATDARLSIYEQMTPSAVVDSLPESPRLWTRMILDGEQEIFSPPLIQEHDPGVFINAGDLYVRKKLTAGEEVCADLARGRVLEVGSGFGRVSRALRERELDVVTTDAERDLVRMYKARGWWDSCQVTLPEVPESLGKFDTIIALRGVLSLAGDIEQVHLGIQRLCRLLNPGGRLLFTSTKASSLVSLPGRPPLEYRVRFIYRGCRSAWLRATGLPESLAHAMLSELGFGKIEVFDPSSSDGSGYYGFATLSK